MSALSIYLTQLRANLASGVATEHTHRPALKTLLEGLQVGVIAHNEPRHTDAGAVDFVVKHREEPIGWVEAKDIGADLGKVAKTDQLKRYLGAYPNLILTDYVTFRTYLNGKLVGDEALGVVDGAKIASTADKQAAVEKLLHTFLAQEVYRPGKPEDLARRMAHFAEMARDAIIGALNSEGQRGQLHSQMAAFRETLLPDLSEEQFADMYAQTIAYGLFAAKCHHPLGDDFSRWTAAKYLPPTNPFLQRLFHELTGPDLDPEVEWVVDGLVSLLRNTDMSAVVQAFAKHQQGREDPVVHFYETFLKEYNPRERKIRGVYYTPEPVVSYIVRSVDHLLKTEFDKPLGLADPEVFILDPACGTGTFLYFVIEHIWRTVTKDGQDRGTWPGYVRDKLLGRLFGFELLMAPYTIAHLKLAQLLREHGYDFPDDQRLGIYLTNTLEEARFRSETLVQRYISEEAEAAAEVKRDKPIMVVLGNPPYAGHSSNASDKQIDVEVGAKVEVWRGHRRTTVTARPRRGASSATVGVRVKTFIGALLEDYFWVDGRVLDERNSKWLQDDYVKFFRFGQWRIQQTGYGILALVTNHGYLDNPTFRGMRQRLLEVFTRIRVLDLHGSSKRREALPFADNDENVFDIQQGVTISVLSKLPGTAACAVERADIWGRRPEKYSALEATSTATTEWTALAPSSPHYLFVSATEPEISAEYVRCPSIADTMEDHWVGLYTGRDALNYAFDRRELARRVTGLVAPQTETEYEDSRSLAKEYRLDLIAVRQRFPNEASIGEAIVQCAYRPFDRRALLYDETTVKRPRRNGMRHMLAGPNLGLIVNRQIVAYPPQHAWVVENPVDLHIIETAHASAYLFALYLYPDRETLEADDPRRPNLSPAFVVDLAGRLGLTFIEDGRGDLQATFGPEDVFHYIYAVLHSPTYRRRYAEFLKIDFPRIPLTSDRALFARLCDLGEELVALHLLKSPLLADSPASYPVIGTDLVEAVRYDEAHQRVYLNQTQYFGGIAPALYAFQVGGYQVLNKWLKDRKGRTLSNDDVQHYQQVAAALTHTMRLMREIDEAIPSWPLT